jgi:CheY-like chemotaxis protein
MQAVQAQGKPTVLVVDDSRVVRHAINKILAPEFSIVEAGDGLDGWRSAQKHPALNLVISDIQMPELDGYGMICKIRAADDPGLREVPIIVITGAEDETTRERAYACGANDFIQKPFNANQLLDSVRMHISHDQNRGEELAAQYGNHIESIVVADSGAGGLADAIDHLSAALNILNSIDGEQLAPKLPALALKVLPLLKQCNAAYRVGLDAELAALEKKLASLHPGTGKAS